MRGLLIAALFRPGFSFCSDDGSVVKNGAPILATVPCKWNFWHPDDEEEPISANETASVVPAQSSDSCAASLLLQDLADGRVQRSHLELVIAHKQEDLSWCDPFDSVRTIYTKAEHPPSKNGHWKQLPSGRGREARAYLQHIIANYDSLAKRTVFMQGSMPTCGYFLPTTRLPYGGHLCVTDRLCCLCTLPRGLLAACFAPPPVAMARYEPCARAPVWQDGLCVDGRLCHAAALPGGRLHATDHAPLV